MDKSKEYLMLRDEIVHLDEMTNNTINFSYAFVSAILSFSFTQKDSIFILLPYIVIIPAYKIVLTKSQAVYKITAYLYVFLEGEDFLWEHRRNIFITSKGGSMSLDEDFRYFHYPFLIDAIVTSVFFVIRNDMCVYGVIKLFIAVALFTWVLRMFFKYKRSETQDYIEKWKEIKSEEQNQFAQQ